MSRFSGFLKSGTIGAGARPAQPKTPTSTTRKAVATPDACTRRGEPAPSSIKPTMGEVDATVASIRRLNDLLADANEQVVSIGLERDQAVKRAEAAERRAEKAERDLAEALRHASPGTTTSGARATSAAPRTAPSVGTAGGRANLDRDALRESILDALAQLGPSRWGAVLEHMKVMGGPVVIGARSDLMADGTIVKTGEIYGIRRA